MKKIIVIGGGPAGIMAALTAANGGAEVALWERNKSLGRKLAITGKGRCNITNMADTKDLVKNMPGNGSFLYSAFTRFSAEDTWDFFEQHGLQLKVERGRRVFPLSDNAHEVVEVLVQALHEAGVKIEYNLRAKELALQNKQIIGVYDYPGRLYPADAVIIATGGVTYPATGSTGDGYALAAQAGHTIIPPKPSLVPLETVESWPSEVSGLALKNVEMTIRDQDKVLDKAFGEMLFTHFGLSGPIVLSLSKVVTAAAEMGRGLTALIDLKPALSEEKLDERLLRNNQKFSRKHFINSLDELLPASLIPVFVRLVGIDPHKPVNQLTKEERREMVYMLKSLPLTIKGPRPISEAIVTSGGVQVKEINPKSMASNLISGLYFSGEVIDIDGYTGGYNLQAAWSSGYVAGCRCIGRIAAIIQKLLLGKIFLFVEIFIE